jgi:hypothetical protein
MSSFDPPKAIFIVMQSVLVTIYIFKVTIRLLPSNVGRSNSAWMIIVVTAVLAGASLYIILSKHYEQDSLKWAYGTLGTKEGYWLKK